MDDQTQQKKDDQAVRDQVALVSFIDDLLKEKNDQSIKPDALPKVKEMLLKQLNEMINIHMISLLSEKDQTELDKLLDSNASNEELDKFFESKIFNLKSEIASVLLDFRASFLGLYKKSEDKESKEEQANQAQTDNNEKEELENPQPAPVPVD